MKIISMWVCLLICGTAASEEEKLFDRLFEEAKKRKDIQIAEIIRGDPASQSDRFKALYLKQLEGIKTIAFSKVTVAASEKASVENLEQLSLKLENRLLKLPSDAFLWTDKTNKERKYDAVVSINITPEGRLMQAVVTVRRPGLFKFGNEIVWFFPVVWEEHVLIDRLEQKSLEFNTVESAFDAVMTKLENSFLKANKK